MHSIKKCSWCGQEAEAAAEACTGCGTAFEAPRREASAWPLFEGALVRALAPKLLNRYPALSALGNWWLELLVLFLLTVAGALATHSPPLWVLALILSQCSAFARVAQRQLKQGSKADYDLKT